MSCNWICTYEFALSRDSLLMIGTGAKLNDSPDIIVQTEIARDTV